MRKVGKVGAVGKVGKVRKVGKVGQVGRGGGVGGCGVVCNAMWVVYGGWCDVSHGVGKFALYKRKSGENAENIARPAV